jgi:hypothetical protein
MKEAILYYNPAAAAAEAYKAARTYEFAYSNSTASASALSSFPSQASIHAAELAEQIEELRASVHVLNAQGRYHPGYSSAPRSVPRPDFLLLAHHALDFLRRPSNDALLNDDVLTASAQVTVSTPAACQARTSFLPCRNQGPVRIFVIPFF